jgi:hypothetical protein
VIKATELITALVIGALATVVIAGVVMLVAGRRPGTASWVLASFLVTIAVVVGLLGLYVPWTVALMMLLVASRPVEVHLWRRGWLSQRTMALLLVGRFPVLVGLIAVVSDASLTLVAVVVAISLVPVVLMYPVAKSYFEKPAEAVDIAEP